LALLSPSSSSFAHFLYTMTRVLAIALALFGAAAVAVPFTERQLDDPGCVASVPANADPDTVNKVYLAAVARNVDMRVCSFPFGRLAVS
jgi:hypothetical protein